MKITKIETFTSKDCNVSIVKVTTEDGRIGIGQLATFNADTSAFVLHRQVSSYFIGQNVYDIEKLIPRAIEGTHKFIGSHITRAVGGIESAVLDWLGKDVEKTVCEYLGGKIVDIDVYGSSMSRSITPKDEAERLNRLKGEQGFRAFKIRIGSVFGHDVDEWEGRTEEIVPTVRGAIGYDTKLLTDANSCYTPERAVEVGRMLEQNDIFHFEEPCPHMELTWTKQVTDALSIDVAGGEQDNIMATWKMMIDMGAVNIVQPDVLYIGGMYRSMEVAKMASAKGMVCTPHSANHALVTLFTAHLMGVVDNPGQFLEFGIEECKWAEGIYEPMPKVADGKIRISDEPGWGIRINDDWLEKTDYMVSEL